MPPSYRGERGMPTSGEGSLWPPLGCFIACRVPLLDEHQVRGQTRRSNRRSNPPLLNSCRYTDPVSVQVNGEACCPTIPATTSMGWPPNCTTVVACTFANVVASF